MVMHYAGYACRMPEIMRNCRTSTTCGHRRRRPRPRRLAGWRALGTWGDVGCFSFFSNKNLTTGEGGMVITDDADLAEKLRLLRSHGMTTLTWDRHQGHAYSYDVVDLGYNYRIDEIRSALGRVQLAKLEHSNARRRAITLRVWQALAETGLELPFMDLFQSHNISNAIGDVVQKEYSPAHHLLPVLLAPGADRLAFVEKLKAAGIQTSLHYPPIHTFSYYQQRFGKIDLPRTEAAAAREVTLPLYPGMTEEQVELIINCVKRAN